MKMLLLASMILAGMQTQPMRLPPKPIMELTQSKTTNIEDRVTPEFSIIGVVITPPRVAQHEYALVGSLRAELVSSTVRDIESGGTYKVIVVGNPIRTSPPSEFTTPYPVEPYLETYEVRLRVVGGKVPLSTRVRGFVTIRYTATSLSRGVESEPATAEISYSVAS